MKELFIQVAFDYPYSVGNIFNVREGGEPVFDYDLCLKSGVIYLRTKADRWSRFYRRGIRNLFKGEIGAWEVG